MGAHDRPFPPAGLPPQESKLFKMAYELAYRQANLIEQSAVDGQGTAIYDRWLGEALEIEVEFQITVPAKLVRYWIRIRHEDALVFDAWCSRDPGGATVGMINAFRAGPWTFFLRTSWESERKP